MDAYRGLIFAADASNIAVVGPGKIVGSPKLGGLRNAAPALRDRADQLFQHPV